MTEQTQNIAVSLVIAIKDPSGNTIEHPIQDDIRNILVNAGVAVESHIQFELSKPAFEKQRIQNLIKVITTQRLLDTVRFLVENFEPLELNHLGYINQPMAVKPTYIWNNAGSGIDIGVNPQPMMSINMGIWISVDVERNKVVLSPSLLNQVTMQFSFMNSVNGLTQSGYPANPAMVFGNCGVTVQPQWPTATPSKSKRQPRGMVVEPSPTMPMFVPPQFED